MFKIELTDIQRAELIDLVEFRIEELHSDYICHNEILSSLEDDDPLLILKKYEALRKLQAQLMVPQ